MHVDNKFYRRRLRRSSRRATLLRPIAIDRAPGSKRHGRFEFSPNANNGVSALRSSAMAKSSAVFTTLQPVGDSHIDAHPFRPAESRRYARLEFYPASKEMCRPSVLARWNVLVGGSFSSVWGRGGAASKQRRALQSDGSPIRISRRRSMAVDALPRRPTDA
jgi:hypothetical protein